MGIIRKPSIRRSGVRRQRPEHEQSPWSRWAEHIGFWPALAALAFFVGATAIALLGQPALRYSEGQSIDQPIPARVEFTRVNPARTNEARQAARAAVPNYYRINRALLARILQDLGELREALGGAANYDEFKAAPIAADLPLTREEFERLKGIAPRVFEEVFSKATESLAAELLRERIYDRRPTPEERSPRATRAVIIDEAGESEPLDVTEFTPYNQKAQVNGRAADLSQIFRYPLSSLQPTVKRILANRLTSEPLLVFDPNRTQQAMQAAEQAVPEQQDVVEKGKPFVFARPGQGLTAADVELVQEEQAAYQRFLESGTPQARAARRRQALESVGTSIVFLALSVSLFSLVGMYQRRILEIHTRTLAFSGLVLAALLAARIVDVELNIKELTLAPMLVAASIITIVYRRQFAAGVMVLAGLLAVLAVRGGVDLFVAMLLGSFATVYLLGEVRTRTRIITAGVVTGALLFAVSFAFGLSAQQEPHYILTRAGYAASAAVAAAMFVTAVLPYIERVFKIATALTLLEWRDPTRPLLQRLAGEAPGTYNHSLVLGTMAEAACEAIGANGLLAQVGALYHDIGKILKPDYFTENQQGSISRHDHLAPSMSLLIILGHVKDGIELAKEYNLPRVLFPFIEEHHGTTLVRYFHHVASQKQPQIAVGKHDREVSEVEFRYPGPKPRSKETAVLMLCDSVEGAVRALDEPSAGKIESTVHQIVMDRLNDGQFDDCDITLKELHRVEESLVKSLVRFYHGRVAYPKARGKERTSVSGPPRPAAAG
ncbi:MAG TPA: HDIG domain-containing protein [Phycisphaerae bacterium]|jgi:hypothetical protein